jgi:hypothetical protein
MTLHEVIRINGNNSNQYNLSETVSLIRNFVSSGKLNPDALEIKIGNIFNSLKSSGYSKKSIRRASNQLKIISRKM